MNRRITCWSLVCACALTATAYGQQHRPPPSWIGESDQADAHFGFRVAPAGDVNGDGFSDVIVGANLYDNGGTSLGRAFVYLGSSTGLVTTPAWTAQSHHGLAYFGSSVATAGDVNGDGYSDVIVGATRHDNGNVDEGAAFLYLGSSSGLAASPAWTAEGDQAGALFGWSAATAGDVNADGYSDVIVSAPSYDNGQSNEGRVFVYLGSAAGLGSRPVWTAESDQLNASTGASVATAGDVNGDGYDDVIVGSPFFTAAQFHEGRACVYLGCEDGLGTTAAWTADAGQMFSSFGRSVGPAGDVNGDGYADVIVGAFEWDGGETDEGSAFVYLGSRSGLSSSPDWAAEGDEVLAAFGHSVATAGDVNGDGFSDVIVGAKWADGGETNEGRAYVYLGSPGGISTSAEWILESDQADAQFGFAVGTAGDVNGDGYSDVIVGALFFDNGETDEGRAFVYHGAADVLALTHVWEAHSDQSFADFGHALASAGDVDGDGYGDVIVGAPNYNSGQFNEGRALVYRGTPAGVATSASWHVDSNQVGAYLGESVASAGDVNGDGYSDVIVGAPFHDADTVGGRAFVYHGSSSGLATTYAWAGQADLPDCVYGSKVACAGDVNGDGYSDVIVGAYGYGTPSYGRAFVYLGSSTGLATTPSWTADSGQQGAGFGVAVSTAGDVNGDGFSDVIVGAWAHDNGETSEGRAFVYLGSHSGLSTTPAWTAESNEVGGTLGRDATTAGDVNGDHYSDVIVSCRGCSNGEHAEGVAFVYLGSSAGLSTTPDWTGETNQINAGFSGIAVASAGDVNGDGFSDVVFGASAYDVGSHLQAGRMALHLGSSTGLALSPAWVIEGDHQGANVGNFLARAGDVNGDGYGDLLTGGGGAFLYLGNEGRGGWTIAPQQRQASDVTPIQSLNRSNDRLEFRIHLAFARTLAGFDWSTGIAPLANLEWEVEPLSSPLDGDDVRSGIGDVAIDGSLIRFNEIASFEDIVTSPSIGHHVAAISRPYHWRARIRTNNPLFPVTPWVTIPGNNVSETKLRAGPVRAKR